MSLKSTTAALVTATLALTGCSLLSGSDDEPTPKATAMAAPTALPTKAWATADAADVADGGNLTLGATALPANFNPRHADAADSDVDRILAPTVGSAVRVTADGGWEVDPDYAESVEVTDEDPLTVEVRLNPRAVWQGGTSITADDMVAYWKAQNGSNAGFLVASTEGFSDISAVEPGEDEFSYTVRFTSPTTDWPAYVYPRLPANVSSSPDLFNAAFVARAVPSNGPFVVSLIDAATGTVIETRNPRWWGRTPKLETITWRIAAPDVQAKAYVAGELDAVDVDPASYGAVGARGSLQRASGSRWTQLTLNGGRGPLQDVAVRRAVAVALDRQAIADAAAKTVGAPGTTMGSVLKVPGQRGYVDSSAVIAHDPAKAASLLDAAGWVDDGTGRRARDGTPLTLSMPVPAGTPTSAARAEAVVADLAAVGITVTLTTVPAETFFDTVVVPLDFDLVTFSWSSPPFSVAEAEARFYPIDSSQNFTGRAARSVDKAWQKAVDALGDADLAAAVTAVDAVTLSAAQVIPIGVTPEVVAVRDGLVNYGATTFEQPDWTVVGLAVDKRTPATE